MTQVYLIIAEHFHVPGIITRVCATREKAESEALELVNIMLKDAGAPLITEILDIEKALARLQDEYGAAHCYVEMTEENVL